jgi:two-component sensor histidine kinase
VKNNLQVIASMLSLQASSAPNDAARELLKESYHRVHVMSDVHRQFYDVQPGDTKEQNISHYLHELVHNLTVTLSAGSKDIADNLEVLLAIDEVAVPIDQIVPLGLIANELLTNVFKYAFPTGFNERRPALWVALTLQAEQVCLLVRDNGVGIAAGGKSARSSSLGMGIVNALAGQLGGRVVVRDAFAPVPADMPQLDPPAAFVGSPGTVAQVCIPHRRATDKK